MSVAYALISGFFGLPASGETMRRKSRVLPGPRWHSLINSKRREIPTDAAGERVLGLHRRQKVPGRLCEATHRRTTLPVAYDRLRPRSAPHLFRAECMDEAGINTEALHVSSSVCESWMSIIDHLIQCSLGLRAAPKVLISTKSHAFFHPIQEASPSAQHHGVYLFPRNS